MDIIGLKNYLNCDNIFLESIIRKFIEEVREITKTVEKAAANKKWKIVKSNVHKMLSSVKIFEIDELLLLLEKMEINAEAENNIQELTEDVKKLANLVEKTILNMQTALQELN